MSTLDTPSPTRLGETPDQSVLDECLAAATLAPSSHNTQPWRFRVLRETVDLVADRTRALPSNDPHDRELTISCGAALFNFRVAAAARGWTALIEELPFSDDDDLLARITLCHGVNSGIKDATALATAIGVRRTYRKRFLSDSIDQRTVDSLVLAAEGERCLAVPVTSMTERERAAALIGEADELLWRDPVWRREISSWMHPQRKHEGFGVPGLSRQASELVVRTFDLGAGVAAHDQQILESAPLILIIGSPTDEATDWLRTGQALERVLLTACVGGLQASFLNQPVHFERLRSKLRELVPQALTPQIMLRLGRTVDELAPVVRRPVTELVNTGWLGD